MQRLSAVNMLTFDLPFRLKLGRIIVWVFTNPQTWKTLAQHNAFELDSYAADRAPRHRTYPFNDFRDRPDNSTFPIPTARYSISTFFLCGPKISMQLKMSQGSQCSSKTSSSSLGNLNRHPLLYQIIFICYFILSSCVSSSYIHISAQCFQTLSTLLI
jgi:hypothetical protein